MMVVSACSVNFGATLAVKLFRDVGPLTTAALRLVISAIVLAPLLRRRHFTGDFHRLRVAVGFGVILAAMNATFYEAICRIPLGVGVTIEFIGPLGLALVGSRHRGDIVWASMAAGGVILLGSGAVHDLDLVGVAWGVAAGGCWAGYILFSKSTGREFPGPSGLAVALVVSSLVILPLGVATTKHSLLDGRVLMMGATIAVLSTVIPYSLELAALRHLSSRYFGVVLALAPGIAAAMGFFFLSQRPSTLEIVALVLVVGANAGNAATDRSRARVDGRLAKSSSPSDHCAGRPTER